MHSPPPPANQRFDPSMRLSHQPLANTGAAAHSERALRRFAEAVLCFQFDVRCIDDTTGKCTFNETGMPFGAIAQVVPKLRQRNANGSAVFIRPCRPFAFADDVPAMTLPRMLDDGLRIAAVIETSPGSFQVWVPLGSNNHGIEPKLCVAACERVQELYETDYGVVHSDSFGRAPGFRNRKSKHRTADGYPLVTMLNQHSHFRGYDRTLLDEAREIAGARTQPLDKRSVGAVQSPSGHIPSSTNADLGPLEIWDGERHVVTLPAVDIDSLYEEWLAVMIRSGYAPPWRQHGPGVDRSKQDLNVIRSMAYAGVTPDIAARALLEGSDKAQERGPGYVAHILEAIYGEKPNCHFDPRIHLSKN
jgi:hypothetical protein